MSNRGVIRYVFTSSHTSQGFYTFIPDLLEGLRKVYILKGAPGSGKSTFIRILGERMSEKGYDVEFWISALDPVTPDGVYVHQLDMAVVNGSLPQAIDPKYPGVRDEIINLSDFWDKMMVEGKHKEIIQLVDEVLIIQTKVYEYLQEAASIRQETRDMNLGLLSVDKVREMTEGLAAEILANQPGEKHYFAGALTAEGMISYINELSEGCRKRYIVKGPSGSGKSRVISELARKAQQKGYFLEYYHCGLEPEAIDMLIIRDLQVALIEAGEVEIALKPWDFVVDMTTCLENYDPEQAHLKNIEGFRRVEGLQYKAQQELQMLSNHTRKMKKIYASAMDFERLDEKIRAITNEFFSARS